MNAQPIPAPTTGEAAVPVGLHGIGRWPVRDRRHAIARAAAAVAPPSRALGQWAYVEATRTGDWWTCVLDDRKCIRVVKVHATTGVALVVYTSPLPVRRGGPHHLNDRG